jgi:2-hydroxy-3-keto-5-methylthiopentenyl-1-phosphate phosphatase
MEQSEWEINLIEILGAEGWACDRDDETTLGFKKGSWIRDYNKETRRFVQFNGDQVVNIRCTKGE